MDSQGGSPRKGAWQANKAETTIIMLIIPIFDFWNWNRQKPEPIIRWRIMVAFFVVSGFFTLPLVSY